MQHDMEETTLQLTIRMDPERLRALEKLLEREEWRALLADYIALLCRFTVADAMRGGEGRPAGMAAFPEMVGETTGSRCEVVLERLEFHPDTAQAHDTPEMMVNGTAGASGRANRPLRDPAVNEK